MSRRSISNWFHSPTRIRHSRAGKSHSKRRHARRPGIERLAERLTPAVTALWSLGNLSVIGDSLDNTIEVSRDATGAILVNGGAVSVRGGTPTVANTAQISIFGLSGNDNLSLNEANGALPRANMFGGAGNDLLAGGAGNDMLFGQGGQDTLLGRGGFDFLFGGADNDSLTGGDGDDQVFGESGNDRFIWNPGDDTDLNEGGSGSDTVEVNGGNGGESFTVTANGTRVRFDRLDPAPFSIDIGSSESLLVNANGGDDAFSATGNLAALISITVDGGAGNDTLRGSNGPDVLLGGDGADDVDGQQGNDTIFLGAGDDSFQWDPGDGSDIVEGQDGNDTLVFNGSSAGELLELTANGQRVRLTRNVGTVVMDLDGIESVDLNALGGADTLVVNHLSGTAVANVGVHLAGTLGGSTGDTQPDTIIVNATSGDDIIDVFGSGTTAQVVGLSTLLTITGSEGAHDSLVINSLAGNDGVTASTLPAGTMKLTLDGGAGNDTLLGSQGADVLLGGEGSDFFDGQQGNDLILMGAGDDRFEWQPGEGSDTLEGQDGHDLMLFFGSNADEFINVLANGGRVLFTRDVANVTLDLNDVESIEFRALGGADNIVVGDLSGTDLTRVEIDLRGPQGVGDQQADSVTVAGTNGDDTFGASGDAGGVHVFGLQAAVQIFHAEAANDTLTLNALGGSDAVNAQSLEADGMRLIVFGGLGNDALVGGEGNDVFIGGDGDDLILMGAGDDTAVWNPGDDDDTIEGQDGFDTLVFNGANVSENISISANGARTRFTRDVANVVMDLDDVEGLDFSALGGADVIVVNDLSGTDVTVLNFNLATSGGAGDAQPDNVILLGTADDDVVLVLGDANGVSVLGLSWQVNITGSEPANDRVTVNSLAGDDVVDGSGLAAGGIGLVADGGAGNDVLIGSDGADVLLGGDGDDVLLGGLGIDVLDGGAGDNIVIQ